jgi:hypothetical protein
MRPTAADKVDVDARLAAGSDPAESTVEEWPGWQGGTTVQLWTIPEGGHTPQIAATLPATLLDVLANHPKP